MTRADAGRPTDAVWFLAFALTSSAWCLGAGHRLGATFDEPFYLSSGLEHWRTGSCRTLMKAGTMPLPVDLQTLPLYLWERCRGEHFDLARDCQRILPVARAGTLAFWWLLLLYGWRTGRVLAGPWGGRLAVALLACEPSLLAHAGLATTDIAVSACLLALAYHFRTGRDAGWPRRVAVPALWFAAAVLAKASGPVFGTLCLLAVELERRFRQPPQPACPAARLVVRAVREARWDFSQIFAGGLLLTFLYVGSDWQSERTFVEWAHRLPNGPLSDAMVWLSEHLRIFSNAGEGLVQQVKHNVRGHSAYLFGRTAGRAMWYYFPALLTIKLSVPVLLALVYLGLVRPKALVNWACVAAAVLVVFSLAYRVQIGVRLVLPIVALGLTGVGAALAAAARQAGPYGQRRLVAVGSAAGVLWTAGCAWAVWPNGLSYVNELWGGTRRGYRIVSESNYDWGQGLPELAHWQRRRGIKDLDLWYFGTDPEVARLPLRLLPLHSLSVATGEEVAEQLRGRHLAVSTTLLYGSYVTSGPGRAAAQFLRTQRPVARTTTFLIYDFTGEPPVARGPTVRRGHAATGWDFSAPTGLARGSAFPSK